MKFSILASLGVNTKAYQKGLDMAKKETESFSKKVTKSLKNIALTFGGFNLIKNLIELGMASKETANMFDTIFADSIDRMREELKELNKVIPETEIKIKEALAVFRQMANGFGIAGAEANDFAIQMVKIGSDFASFRNLKPEEMFVKLRSAVAGMSRPMMDLGINTQVATLEQKAFAMGMQFTSGKLTSAQKAYLTMMVTLEQMGEVLGDQKRTNDSASNQYKHLQKRVLDMSAVLGEKLLPHIVELIQFSHKMLDIYEKNSNAIKGLVKFLLKYTIATKTASVISKVASASFSFLKTTLFVLSGQYFKNVTASMANAKAQKVNTVATNTATIATNRLTLALVKLRMKAMRFPLTLALFVLTDYIAKTYEASQATKALADDTDVDTKEIKDNIAKVVKEMEQYGIVLNKSGALNPYEEALRGGKEMIDQTQTLSKQIEQYFDLVKDAKSKEMDRLKATKELAKINAERKGDKEKVKQLDEEIKLLNEAEQIMKRHGFSMEMSIQMARELASVRKLDPTNQMLEEQEKKEKEIQAMKLKQLQAEESGQEKLAKKMQKRIDAEERALEIAKEHNITLAEAQELVRGLIKQEEKKSNIEATTDITGADKSGSNLLRLANKLGRDNNISFSREDLGGGRTGFRRYDEGSKGRLYSREQLQESVGGRMREMETDSEQLKKLDDIIKALEGKFKNE